MFNLLSSGAEFAEGIFVPFYNAVSAALEGLYTANASFVAPFLNIAEGASKLLKMFV